jgi:hypothetical protein
MSVIPARQVGDTDPTITQAKGYLRRFSYGRELDTGPAYTELFGTVLRRFATARNDEIERGVKQGPAVNTDGVYDAAMKVQLGIVQRDVSPPPAALAHRKIYFYSAPGSGADFNVGPSWDVGEYARNILNINHFPLRFPKGGYLGLMGGDPGLSYVDVITAEDEDLEHQLLANPDIDDPELELWFSGYSQSADGIKRAVLRLFGPGGRFEDRRGRINGLVLFGDPSRQPGPVRINSIPALHRNPPGWGISRLLVPDWLNAITYSITTEGPTGPDMYACTAGDNIAPDDETLLPLFYEWFVEAETELPFVGFSASIIIPALSSYLGIFGIFVGPAVAGLAGLSLEFAGMLVNSYGGKVADPEKVEFLKANVLISPAGVTRVIRTLASLPGIQTHGEYHLPKPEFGGRTGIQVGCDILAAFRR